MHRIDSIEVAVAKAATTNIKEMAYTEVKNLSFESYLGKTIHTYKHVKLSSADFELILQFATL